MEGSTLAMRCPNDSCGCKSGCRCGANCKCGTAAVEKLRCTNEKCDHKLSCNCKGGLCECGGTLERAPRRCGNSNCSCGSNCTCGPSCQCGTKHGESLPKSMTKGMHAPLEGTKDEGRGLAHAEKTK